MLSGTLWRHESRPCMQYKKEVDVLPMAHDKLSQMCFSISKRVCCLQTARNAILTEARSGRALHQRLGAMQGVAPHVLQLCKSAAEEADQVVLEVRVHVPMEALQQA